jgi:cytoskeletal protein CcmA (bactofilin family)
VLRELFGTQKQPQKPKQQAQPPSQPPAKSPATPVRSDSAVGAGSRFEGTIVAEGNIRIDGTFTGNTTTRGRIVIGEKGQIEGNLIGESVEVAGVVKGDIVAKRVSVLRTGRVWGNLRLEKLATEEGCFVQGKVTMEETLDMKAYLPVTPPSAEASEPAPKDEPAPVASGAKVTQINKRQG